MKINVFAYESLKQKMVEDGDLRRGEWDDNYNECYCDDERLCQNLQPIACNDNSEECGDVSTNSSLCVPGLEGGRLYYILLGAGVYDQGIYQLDIEVCDNCPPEENDCVDLKGLAEFFICFTGQDAELERGCEDFDADCDGDLDLYDFAAFRLTAVYP